MKIFMSGARCFISNQIMDRDSYIYYRSWEHQEISPLWWNPKDRNCIRINPRLAVTLSQMNVVHIPVWRLMLFTWAYQEDCPVKFIDFILYKFLISPLSCYMSHSTLSSWLYNAWCLLKIINFEAVYHSLFVLLSPETLKINGLLSVHLNLWVTFFSLQKSIIETPLSFG